MPTPREPDPDVQVDVIGRAEDTISAIPVQFLGMELT